MKKQVKLHNEVNLIGRIWCISEGNYQNNRTTILTMLIPNDENYELDPNRVNVYIPGYPKDSFKKTKGRPLAVTGHIDSKYGFRIIADLFGFLD